MDNGTCTYRVVISGCKSPAALNYNPLANSDDGSCDFGSIPGCNDPAAYNFDSHATVLALPDPCLYDVEGCTDPLALNYNALASMEDGSCTRKVIGCTDITKFNYDPRANFDGTCIDKEFGCLDTTATNFDDAANTACVDCCCPADRDEIDAPPAYATCMNDVDDFKAIWTLYSDEHDLFSTNDHSKAMFEVQELKETHEEMNLWY